MIITEINSLVTLVKQLSNFAIQLQDGWYKGSAEMETFQDQVLMLTEKHTQFTDQLRRYGLSKDERFSLAVQLARQVLEKQEKYVRRLQKSRFLRCWKRAFPQELTYSLERILKIVDAGPQLLAGRVANYDLLERNGGLTPVPLAFIPDHKYVPISKSILEVQTALEDEEGQRVVTLYGGPGLGKSSAVKYLALKYQEEQKQRLTPTFPDGVYYLFSGHEAQGKVQQLQQELMECLGFGAASTAPPNDPTASGAQEREYFQLTSLETKLRSRLLHQKLLIVLDDLWEPKVFQKLLVPAAKGVRYLIASQIREIWGPAEKVQLENPSWSEARQILANYTEGLPTKGTFPDSIQSVADAIIHKLEYHPLSLANVGISVNRKRATDASHWKTIYDNIHVLLDENNCQGCPVVYERPYDLAVGTSMMLMVESLFPEARQLLFLIALFKDQELPVPLVRFFYQFLQTVQANDSLLKYDNHEKYLEDRSLVTLHIREDESNLTAHSLRMHYIREKKSPEVRSIASQILASSDQSVELVQRGDADGTLVTVLSAMYCTHPFMDEAASAFEKHLRIINGGVIHRIDLDSGVSAFDFVKATRYKIKHLVWLLNVRNGDPDWRQEAHECAKKIIIKLACQGKLHDDGMARLLQLTPITSKACEALQSILPYNLLYDDLYDENKPFSKAHGETVKTLLAILQDNGNSTTRRTAVVLPLLHILDAESRDTILSVAAMWMEILAMDGNPILQIAFTNALIPKDAFPKRCVLVMGQFSGILEAVLGLLVSSNPYEVQLYAGETLMRFCFWKCTALKIANIPNALAKLFNLFMSKETRSEIQSIAGAALHCLSCVPENRNKFQTIVGGLEGFGDILANMEGTWQAPRREETGEKDRRKLEKRASTTAAILAELALENDFRATIALLPGVEKGLLLLQIIEMARAPPPDVVHWFEDYSPLNSTRALTVLYPNHRDLPRVECIRELFSSDGVQNANFVAGTYFSVCWTRVLAHFEMGNFKAALENLDLAQHHLDQIQSVGYVRVLASNPWTDYVYTYWVAMAALREIRLSLQVMLEDYGGALLDVNERVEKDAQDSKMQSIPNMRRALTERGIVKRLQRDLQGALDDLNAALNVSYLSEEQYYVLKHRSYVKHLMGDVPGAREDAKDAQQLEDEVVGETVDFARVWQLEKQPINYLGISIREMAREERKDQVVKQYYRRSRSCPTTETRMCSD